MDPFSIMALLPSSLGATGQTGALNKSAPTSVTSATGTVNATAGAGDINIGGSNGATWLLVAIIVWLWVTR